MSDRLFFPVTMPYESSHWFRDIFRPNGIMSSEERKSLVDALDPFTRVAVCEDMPPDQIDFVDRSGNTVGRIINLSKANR